MNITEINKARAIYYGLFSSLFSYIESKEEYEKVVYTITFLSKSPIDKLTEESLTRLSDFVKKENSFSLLQEESNNLFYSPSTSFIPVTASYYAENRDDGQKRIEMSNIVLKSNFRKDAKIFKEAEDHISFIFAFMQRLIEEEPSTLENDSVVTIFTNILNGIIDEFIFKVHSHENSVFYKDLAVILKVFIELERTLLSVEKNQKHEKRAEHNIFHQQKKGFTKKIKRNFDEVTSL